MSAIYFIDGGAVNDRQDWRRRESTGPVLGRRETGFPGIPERFVSKSGVLPDDLVITGMLEATGATWAASITTLRAEIAAHQARAGANTTYTVTFNSSSYANMELLSFKVTGHYQARRSDVADVLAVLPVEFTWRKLA